MSEPKSAEEYRTSVSFNPARLEDITAATAFIEEELEKMDAPMKAVMQINVAIDEIFSNIVHYAYPKDKVGPATVELIRHDDPRGVSIRFIDCGIPYDPLAKDDPDVTLSAEDRDIGGLGIFMVKRTMNDVAYEFSDGQNILTIRKTF